MTGTFTEDTEFSATGATPDQTLTMVAGRKSTSIGPQTLVDNGYIVNSIGSLSPNEIFYDGGEYAITAFHYMLLVSSATRFNTIVFSVEPPFSKITVDINGTEATYNKEPTATTSYMASDGPNFASGTTYTIKVVSIE